MTTNFSRSGPNSSSKVAITVVTPTAIYAQMSHPQFMKTGSPTKKSIPDDTVAAAGALNKRMTPTTTQMTIR